MRPVPKRRTLIGLPPTLSNPYTHRLLRLCRLPGSRQFQRLAPAPLPVPPRPHPPPPALPRLCACCCCRQLGPAFVSYLLATVLTGALYDRAARRHGDGLFCVGADCYFETWCVLAVLNVAAIAATRTLLVRTRPTYARIYAGL